MMTNGDLISRSALLEWVNNQKAEATGVYGNIIAAAIDAVMRHNVTNAIRKAPTVDAEPVRHGVRTVYTIWHSSAWGEIHTKFECCGFDVRGTKKYNYCPNCGAKMDGDNNG